MTTISLHFPTVEFNLVERKLLQACFRIRFKNVSVGYYSKVVCYDTIMRFAGTGKEQQAYVSENF